jgi:hypothetical protein
MIVVFGAKRCKHCREQREALARTYGKNGWMYSDVSEDFEVYKIAKEINVDGIPSNVIFDDNGIEIFRREGKLSPDEAFFIQNKNSIPLSDEDARVLAISGKKQAVLSIDPGLSQGDVAEARKYSGEKVADVKINQITRYAIDSLPNILQQEYLKRGGRKDVAWLVNYNKV